MTACMEMRSQHPSPKPVWRRAGRANTATVVARIRIYVLRSWDSGLGGSGIRARVLPEPKAPTLGVILQIHSCCRRWPSG
jgi:hypothetical protein